MGLNVGLLARVSPELRLLVAVYGRARRDVRARAIEEDGCLVTPRRHRTISQDAQQFMDWMENEAEEWIEAIEIRRLAHEAIG